MKDNDKYVGIYHAGFIGDVNLINHLIKLGMDITEAFYGVIDADHKEIYEYLITSKKIDTARLFYDSAFLGRHKAVEVLLNYNIIKTGTSIYNLGGSKYDLTEALIIAASYGYFEIVNLIVEHTRDNKWLIRSHGLSTAIDLASNDLEIVALLNQLKI